MLTRREFTTLALSTLAWPKLLAQYQYRRRRHARGADLQFPAAAQAAGRRHGPTSSFRRSPSAACASASSGRRCSSRPPHRRQVAREELRQWRLETPLDHFTAIRKKFDSAKIAIRAFNYSFNDSFTEPEIDRGFEIARALGAEFITASSTLTAAKRVAPFAEKHKMIVAMHNHSDVKNPNEFATPESFAAAMAHVEVLQDQSRHRPLHGGEFRRGRVPARAPREHHEPAHQGSQARSGAERGVGRRATRRSTKCCSC